MKFTPLIPELSVSNFERSLKFYIDILGFKIEYDRPQDHFAFLSMDGAQLMIEQINGHWQTASLEHPFGRGINFQIEVRDIEPMLKRLNQAGHKLFKGPHEEWYQVKNIKKGQRQFLVADLDGYLLRFFQTLDETL